MQTRWFGEPWPSSEEGLRAPVCENEQLHVDVPHGRRCIRCQQLFAEGDQGVVMGATLGVEEGWFDRELRHVVCAEHLQCFLLSVLGPEVRDRIRFE